MPSGTNQDFIFRTTSDGILVANNQGVIERINPAAAAMLGITVESVVGRQANTVFQQNPGLLNLFIRDGEQTLNVRLPKRRLAIGVANTDASGSRIILLQDITEKQEFESRREVLVTTMAHDLRNPISAIGGFAELVEKFGTLNEQQQKFTTRIKQTASKLYDVAGSLVDLAWIEAGMPLAHQPIDMKSLVDRVVSKLSDMAQEHQVTFATSLQNPLPTVMGDQMRLEIAVHNLLHNAILYSRPETPIAIHAWGDTNELYFSIADRGIGIDDEEIELIFDRLYRSKDERIRELPGGGLGLTMAKTIVKRHGGDIWASSNLGVGSTFTFVLPVVKQEA
ncbi:MAG: HAMP domain-containing histidine kinase [Chloroflexi bacterium]|nr:HAMP domain-containing histidine kinase [Chloroflexota bacterium]MCC6896439.1 HAMP domain-containing histidine kinase [Anaerolineae bacterium]